MIAVLCLDNSDGMLFNNRRQSRDRILIQDLLDTVGDSTLFIEEYSRPLFPEQTNIRVGVIDETTLQTVDFCFFEKCTPLEFEDMLDKIIVYRWNRDYPADTYCDIGFDAWSVSEQSEFQGSSHTITKVTYVREG